MIILSWKTSYTCGTKPKIVPNVLGLSRLMIKFEMALHNEELNKYPCSNCLEELGLKLLELTDRLRPIEEVQSRMAELIKLHVNAG